MLPHRLIYQRTRVFSAKPCARFKGCFVGSFSWYNWAHLAVDQLLVNRCRLFLFTSSWRQRIKVVLRFNMQKGDASLMKYVFSLCGYRLFLYSQKNGSQERALWAALGKPLLSLLWSGCWPLLYFCGRLRWRWVDLCSWITLWFGF